MPHIQFVNLVLCSKLLYAPSQSTRFGKAAHVGFDKLRVPQLSLLSPLEPSMDIFHPLVMLRLVIPVEYLLPLFTNLSSLSAHYKNINTTFTEEYKGYSKQ